MKIQLKCQIPSVRCKMSIAACYNSRVICQMTLQRGFFCLGVSHYILIIFHMALLSLICCPIISQLVRVLGVQPCCVCLVSYFCSHSSSSRLMYVSHYLFTIHCHRACSHVVQIRGRMLTASLISSLCVILPGLQLLLSFFPFILQKNKLSYCFRMGLITPKSQITK